MEDYNQKNVVKHYTTFGVVKKIIKNGFRLSCGRDKWPDKNDKYDIDEYSKRIGKKVLVGCLCDGAGSIYHWETHAQSDMSHKDIDEIPCCIEFDKTQFKECVHEQDNKKYKLRWRRIIYTTFEQLESNIPKRWKSPQNIPFMKRKEFCVEKEVRIVCETNDDTNEYFIKFDSQCISKVTIGLCDDKQYKAIKDELLNRGISFCQNKLYESQRWEKGVNNVLRNLHNGEHR